MFNPLLAPARASLAERGEHYSVLIRCEDLGIYVKAYLPEDISFDARANYDAPFAQGLNGSLPLLGSALRMIGVNFTAQVLTAQVWQGTEPLEFSLPLVFQAEQDVQREVLDPIKALLSFVWPSAKGAGSLLRAPGPSIDPQRLKENLTPGLKAQLRTGIDTIVSAGKAGYAEYEAQREEAEKKSGRKTISGLLHDPFSYALDGALVVSSSVIAASQQTNGLLEPLADLYKKSLRNTISLTIGKYLFFDSIVITGINLNQKVQPTVDDTSVGNWQYAEATLNVRTYFTPIQEDMAKIFMSSVKASSPDVPADLAGVTL